MGIFISYSNLDGDAVRALVDDLGDAGHDVWLDQDLRGGDAWWRAIIRQIRDCSVFVYAVSDNVLRSKPCQAELSYARALGIPVLPVQIGEIASKRTTDIIDLQVLDYRKPDRRMGIKLTAAVNACAAQRAELPDPLPLPPPIPYEYLSRISTAANSPDLPASDQLAAVAGLRTALAHEEDASVRADIVNLLKTLRARTDLTVRMASEIDALLVAAAVSEWPAEKAETREGISSDKEKADRRERAGELVESRSRKWRSLSAISVGIVALLLYPILLGPVAFVLALLAVKRGEPLANVSVGIALGGCIIGSIVGVVVVGPM